MKDSLIQGTDKPEKNGRFDKLVKHSREYISYFESTSKDISKSSSMTKSNMDRHIDIEIQITHSIALFILMLIKNKLKSCYMLHIKISFVVLNWFS